MKVRFKKLHKDAVMPTKGTSGAAAFDLYTCEDYYVNDLSCVVPTGIAIELPHGFVAEVRPRSGYSAKGIEGCLYKSNIDIQASYTRFPADVILGTIDEDYRGEIGIIVRKHCGNNFYIHKGTRLAQLLIHQIPDVEFEEVQELSSTDRGFSGYGSTGR